jgi:hypothetical protein
VVGIALVLLARRAAVESCAAVTIQRDHQLTREGDYG